MCFQNFLQDLICMIVLIKKKLIVRAQKALRSSLVDILHQVWDVISNQEAVEIISSTPDRTQSTKRLVECAVLGWKRKRRGIAMDDISAICLFFHPSPPSPQLHPLALAEQYRKCQVTCYVLCNVVLIFEVVKMSSSNPGILVARCQHLLVKI